jgi:hypothetical protein
MTMQDETRPTQDEAVDHGAEFRHHRRKHVALWTAVGGTMALIAVLWVMLLPFQLKGEMFSGLKDAGRWYTIKPDGDGQNPSFEETLQGIGSKLDSLEKNQRDRARARQVTEPSPAVRGEIDALRLKIEAASKKNEVAPSEETDANGDIQKQP